MFVLYYYYLCFLQCLQALPRNVSDFLNFWVLFCTCILEFFFRIFYSCVVEVSVLVNLKQFKMQCLEPIFMIFIYKQVCRSCILFLQWYWKTYYHCCFTNQPDQFFSVLLLAEQIIYLLSPRKNIDGKVVLVALKKWRKHWSRNHRESPILWEQDLNLRRTWVHALLNEDVQQW